MKGRFGEDEGDPHLQIFNPNPNLSPSDLEPLSPMDPISSALASRDVLRSILELLPPPGLARAACVCRAWRAAASDREIREMAFRAPWGVRQVAGTPSSAAFWRHPSLDRFAVSHRLRRGDSLPGLALKYSVQVRDIKRVNNMMSEHGIHSRERILIPIGNPDLLRDSICYVEFDSQAQREAAVLYLENDSGILSVSAISERGRRRIHDSVKRSLRVDDGTAEYYLAISDGDPRAAILHFSRDLQWEQQRTSP